MKKVLFFIPNLSVGGAEKVLVNLVNNMDTSKFDITVQTLFAGGINEQFLKKNIRYCYCFKNTIKGNSTILKLFKPEILYNYFIKEHYNIIVSYLEGPTARIVSGCNDNDTKLVCWIHCKFGSPKTAKTGFRSFTEAKRLYSRYNNIVCVSKCVKDFFCKTMEFQGKVDVLYNTNETKEIYRKSLQTVNDVVFDANCFNICSVGKIEPIKGFDRLARVHKRLLDVGINNKVYILGEGAQKKDIELYLKANNLDHSFIFLGYHTNPYKYVSKCDLFVCSSFSEGFSTAATEAIIVGTPVCSVEVSGMKEMLGDNNEYGLVTENNENALFEGIKSILENPNLLAYYKRQVNKRKDLFCTENTVNAVEEMLINL